VLNNKPISPEEELADALDELARDIALIEPDPIDWVGRLIYNTDVDVFHVKPVQHFYAKIDG